jgi:4-amino-4-deoxy-L-arabinose transferase-like glycosyltransferase
LDWLSTALIVIVLGGAGLRFAGGSWALPLDLHPDEWVIVHGALDMARRHSFEPPYYFRPDHVEMQLSNLAYLVYAHLFHGPSPDRVYASDPASFILISRTITACFGIAMIVVAYLIGIRFTRAIGVMAAFGVAFFPPFVVNSHFATPDVPLAFAFMIVILGCMRYLTSPSWGNLLLACLGVSIGSAIKYPGALGALMIAVTVILSGVQARAWRRVLVHGAAAIAAVLGFIFMISPVLFTNFQAVASSFTANETGSRGLGADGLGWLGNIRYYAETFATSAGIILMVCFALGVLWSIHLRLLQSIPLWTGAVVWVLLSTVPLHWPRWGLPMYLTPLLIAPVGAYYSFRYLINRGSARWLVLGAISLGAVAAANLVAGSVAASAQFVMKNTQTLAPDLAARGIDHTNTAFEGYTPLLPGKPNGAFNAFELKGGRLALSSKVHNRPGTRYLVLSSDMYGRFMADPQYVAQRKFYSQVDKQFPLLTTYDAVAIGKPTVFEVPSIWNAAGYLLQAAQGGYSGPTIRVYRVPSG